MPRYAYQKPRARVYSYNFGYMNNYYKPMTHYLDHKQRESSEQPGHLSLAERLKTFPMDGSVYRDRATSAPPQGRHHDAPPNNPAEKPHEKMLSIEAPPTTTPTPTPSLCGGSVVDPTSSRNTPMRLTLKEELRRLPPVWHRHPWDWDCVWIPPHETTVCPHFGVGSYHQLITKFLRLKPYRYMALDDLILKEVPSPQHPSRPRKYEPIWMKHPYRLPIEDLHVPPHESSVWPESIPHFSLVSSYDCMVKYLGIKKPDFSLM